MTTVRAATAAIASLFLDKVDGRLVVLISCFGDEVSLNVFLSPEVKLISQ